MRKFQPNLEKDLKSEMRFILNPIVRDAKALVPNSLPGLSQWTTEGKNRQITASTSAFRRGGFPKFNSNEVRAGIKSEIFPITHKDYSFTSIVRIVNQSAPGAIYETAGRKNPGGAPWVGRKDFNNHKVSHSLNPSAGSHFINSMPGLRGFGARRGRLIYKAWDKDQGRAVAAIMKAIERSAARTLKYVETSQSFGEAA
jgi:hypothetical protein